MMRLKKKQKGMTLIEIMVAVAIVTIIATVAIPSYQRQSLKGKRADGMAILMDAAARQERYFIDNNQYAGTTAALKLPASALSAKGHYKVTIALGTPATSYTMTAVAQGGQANDACKNLIIESNGARSSSSALTKCW